MNKNIKELIDLLNIEIEIIDDKDRFLNDSYMYIDIYKQLFKYLDINNFKRIKDNDVSISILLEVLYKKENANKLSKDIFLLALNLYNFKKIKYYKDDVNFIEFYKELKNIIYSLKEDYDLLIYKQESLIKEKDKRNKLYEYYNRILFCLKNNIYINNNDIKVINKLLEENNYSYVDIKIIIENINLYNNKINKEDVTNISKSIDILKKDYKEYIVNDFIVFDKKDKLNNYINTIYQEVNNNSNIEDITYILDNLNYEDITYILLSVMNKYIKLLNNCKSNLIEDDIFYDNDLKSVILLEYQDYENKYNIVKDYYDRYLKEYYKEVNKEEVEIKEENELYFALTASGTYFEKDLEDISPHYYETIKEALELFKEKTIPSLYLEKFTSKNDKFKYYRKIKYDNIRILYKKIEGNKYLILGVMEKKETWGQKAYDRIISRDRKNIYNEDININNEYYYNIIKKLTKYKRKGK